MTFHRWAAWGGIVFVIMFGIGWSLLAKMAPPALSPALDAQAIADFYARNLTGIRVGLNVVMLACAPMIPFYTLLGLQLAKIEGKTPVFSIAQIILGLSNVLLFYFPVVLWQTAAFRPDRAVEITQALNDIGWMLIMWAFALAAMQSLSIALVVLSDRDPKPMFPRWFGYYNIWTTISLFAGAPIPFFKTGPFAWDGLFGFWLPTISYLLWILLASILLVGVMKRPERVSA